MLVALRVAMSGFSGAVKLGDLDDFINPSQSCVVALNGDKLDLSAAELAVPEGGEVLLRKRGVPSTASTPPAPVVRGAPPSAPGEAVKVSLSDCLACSGCVTSAETVLLEAQSAEAFKRALRRLPSRRARTPPPRSSSTAKPRGVRSAPSWSPSPAAVPRVPRRGRGPGRAGSGAEADGLLQVHRRRARLRRRRRARRLLAGNRRGVLRALRRGELETSITRKRSSPESDGRLRRRGASPSRFIQRVPRVRVLRGEDARARPF